MGFSNVFLAIVFIYCYKEPCLLLIAEKPLFVLICFTLIFFSTSLIISREKQEIQFRKSDMWHHLCVKISYNEIHNISVGTRHNETPKTVVQHGMGKRVRKTNKGVKLIKVQYMTSKLSRQKPTKQWTDNETLKDRNVKQTMLMENTSGR